MSALDLITIVVIITGGVLAAMAWRWAWQDKTSAAKFASTSMGAANRAEAAAKRAEVAAARADVAIAGYLKVHPENGAAELGLFLPGGATGLPTPPNAAERALGKRLGGEGQ